MSPKIAYRDFNFTAGTLATIERANQIIAAYQAQGFDLTLRQLYYQFVARGLIPNRDSEYKKLGSIINDARLAGMVDWDAIQDRTRNLRKLNHWDDPKDILEAVAAQFRYDAWADQDYRPEVWIEKDALVGVIAGVCDELDVPYFSCRGYTSQSEMWVAGQRLDRYLSDGQQPLILHLGDHDPSGIDMSRDIRERLELFMGGTEFERLALNMDQVDRYAPPPNPAKITDSRAVGYIALHGNESWELDALEPQVLADLIRDAVLAVRDDDKWNAAQARIDEERATFKKVAEQWQTVKAGLS